MKNKLGNYLRYKSKSRLVVLGVLFVFIIFACSHKIELKPEKITQQVSESTELNIWWEQGLNWDEDEAIRCIVRDWQKLTGNKANLSLYANNGLTAKIERALKVDNPPDILMTPKAERVLYPRLAWQGELEDVADIIEPIEDEYSTDILKGITYYNRQNENRSYYAIPVYQATMSIFYWQSLLASIALSPQDIPRDWKGFWQFWQQAQAKLNLQNHNIFGLGLSLSGNESADDTHYLFEQILEAYDVSLLDDHGNLNIDATRRQGIIDCLNWYAQMYYQGYIPPDAVKWSNIDNNLKLLNRLVLMTPNGSLSIPASVRQDRDTYYNQLGITEFPQKPSAEPMRYLIFIRQAVIFQDSPHKSLAKSFLRYFIQPQITIEYLKATGGRNQPVTDSAWSDSFWQDTQDPYIASATKILTSGQTRLSHIVDNPAYSQVLAENIWGKALTQVTASHIPPEQVADEAIARIKAIFTTWEKS
ncbi:MAG: ABC transporter substrate-binding protein [Cyanobacteria bacterium P01_A01_bin.40]